ncbi:MAG: hypothetical protein CMM93_09015 [Rickettsiales bacterium]|nr:hypothetical protein [Rickettsiales bacterium]MAR57310.1 hypothetical protein [Rickettsiales bacterium]
MKKLTISMVLMGLMAFGCGDDDRATDDDGITIPDSGVADMNTTTPDMNTTTPDMGEMRECAQELPNLVEINASPEGMGMILPRCEAATLECLQGCEDAACEEACFTADGTPDLDLGGGNTIDCNLCYNVQFNYCIYDGCPDEFSAFLCCAEDNGCSDINNCPACSAEQDTLLTCAQPVLNGCGEFVVPCFATE